MALVGQRVTTTVFCCEVSCQVSYPTLGSFAAASKVSQPAESAQSVASPVDIAAVPWDRLNACHTPHCARPGAPPTTGSLHVRCPPTDSRLLCRNCRLKRRGPAARDLILAHTPAASRCVAGAFHSGHKLAGSESIQLASAVLPPSGSRALVSTSLHGGFRASVRWNVHSPARFPRLTLDLRTDSRFTSVEVAIIPLARGLLDPHSEDAVVER